MATTSATIIQDMLIDLNVVGPAEPIPGPIGDWCLRVWNRLVDNWNAERAAVYAENLLEFTFVPNLTPHTIGPTGTFSMPNGRPVSIELCSVVQQPGTTQAVKTPVEILDYATYVKEISTPLVTTTFPNKVYYEPDFPNGSLYFYPVPTTAYGCEIVTRLVLAGNLLMATAFSMPAGYQDAMMRTLMAMCCSGLGRTMTPKQEQLLVQALARVFGNNDVTPHIPTLDGGMPDALETDTRTLFNYHDRSWGGSVR